MKQFFDYVRSAFGNLNQKQVEGFEALIKQTEALPLRHRAYILATTWHETARTMQPIKETGLGKNKIYGVPDPVTKKVYYGRGYVQLTWKVNYEKAEKRLKELGLIDNSVDLVNNPDLVMRPDIAARILVIGMTEGWFTGKKLADYDSYVNMRRVVNGVDKAELIATHAYKFEDALKLLKASPAVIPPPPDVEPTPVTPPPKGMEKSIAAVVIGAVLAAFAAFAVWMTGAKQ